VEDEDNEEEEEEEAESSAKTANLYAHGQARAQSTKTHMSVWAFSVIYLGAIGNDCVQISVTLGIGSIEDISTEASEQSFLEAGFGTSISGRYNGLAESYMFCEYAALGGFSCLGMEDTTQSSLSSYMLNI
jgi:hypothetical protein